MNRIVLILIVLLSFLTSSAWAQSGPAQSLPPVSVFSSFLSDAGSQDCAILSCVHDFIPAEYFFQNITDKNKFVQAAASQDGFDYEILIANTLKISTTMPMITEIDVTWRGIPLSTYQFSQMDISVDMQDTEKQVIAKKTIESFFEYSQREQVFSAEFLFAKLKASNYKRDLKLPATIDAFLLDDMQLYRDPFQGAVARYTHPEYSKEVLDIFIYPAIDNYPEQQSDAPPRVISEELHDDINDIQLVAKARNIGEISIGAIKRIEWNVENALFRGYYFDVEAKDSGGEPLFTTTYLFKNKDKLIKFSANFPDRIAHPLIRRALPQIEVPEPSELMRSVRKSQG